MRLFGISSTPEVQYRTYVILYVFKCTTRVLDNFVVKGASQYHTLRSLVSRRRLSTRLSIRLSRLSPSLSPRLSHAADLGHVKPGAGVAGGASAGAGAAPRGDPAFLRRRGVCGDPADHPRRGGLHLPANL